MNQILIDGLVKKGWSFNAHNFNSIYDYLAYGEYNLSSDTGSWLMLHCGSRRVYDIYNPGDYEATWMVGLVQYLVNTDIKLNRIDKIDTITNV